MLWPSDLIDINASMATLATLYFSTDLAVNNITKHIVKTDGKQTEIIIIIYQE